jgi:hypothetical protein
MSDNVINLAQRRREAWATYRDEAYSEETQTCRLSALLDASRRGDAVQAADMLCNVLAAARPGDELVESIVATLRLSVTVHAMAAAIVAETGAAVPLRQAKAIARHILGEHPACSHDVAALAEDVIAHRFTRDELSWDDVRSTALAVGMAWESVQ